MLRPFVDFPNLHGRSLEHARGVIWRLYARRGIVCRPIVSLSARSYFVCIPMAGTIQFVGCDRPAPALP